MEDRKCLTCNGFEYRLSLVPDDKGFMVRRKRYGDWNDCHCPYNITDPNWINKPIKEHTCNLKLSNHMYCSFCNSCFTEVSCPKGCEYSFGRLIYSSLGNFANARVRRKIMKSYQITTRIVLQEHDEANKTALVEQIGYFTIEAENFTDAVTNASALFPDEYFELIGVVENIG